MLKKIICLNLLVCLTFGFCACKKENDSHTHTLTKIEKVEPTCTQSGNNAYYKCVDCEKLFDENGETETSLTEQTLSALGHEDEDTDNVCDICEKPLTPPSVGNSGVIELPEWDF